MITICEDMGQKIGKHVLKNNFFAVNGLETIRIPLPVGDYIVLNDKVQDVINRKDKRGNDLKKMDFLGTYSVSVDTKEHLLEIIGNINGASHGRFRDECILAQNNNIKLYILVENTDGIKKIQDLFSWQNPRMHKYNKIMYMHNLGKWSSVPLPKAPPTSGQTLAKAMLTMQAKYGVEFQFCKPGEAGAKVLELLEVDV